MEAEENSVVETAAAGDVDESEQTSSADDVRTSDNLLVGELAAYNTAALQERERFRSAVAGRPNPFDSHFFETRSRFPYFGYVLAEFDDCPALWLFNNDDDLVAQHYFWYGANGYEPLTMKAWIALAQDAGTVFDVGAFSGVYGLVAHFASPDASVHCFEPTMRGFSRLLDNIKANLVMNQVSAHRLALGAEEGEVTMLHYRSRHELGSGVSYKRKAHEASVVESERCPVTTLDTLVATVGVPDLVKIDVEEAELDVLDGAAGLIDLEQAAFVIEVVPATYDGVLDRLHNYRCLLIDEPTGRVTRADDRDALLLLSASGFANLVVVPTADRERAVLELYDAV